MTRAEAVKAIRALGLAVRVTDREYRVAIPMQTYVADGYSYAEARTMQEETAYYTMDAQDAVDTAHKIAGK